MSNFLYYSDYKRFISDLEDIQQLAVIARLMNNFAKSYYYDNSAFFPILLDALFKVYPEYDFECDMKVLMDCDEKNYLKYKNPKLEFVGQYWYYLNDLYYENSINVTSDEIDPAIGRIPYDFSEEHKYMANENVNETEENAAKIDTMDNIESVKSVSFKIDPKFKCNIEKIIQELSEDLSVSYQEGFAHRLSNVLTCKDLSNLSEEDRIFRLSCKTNLFVFLVDEIQKTFEGVMKGLIFNNLVVVYTQSGTKLTDNNISAVRSRSSGTKPIHYKEVQKTINRYSPSNYSC